MANPLKIKPFTINDAISAFVDFFSVHMALRPSLVRAGTNDEGTWIHLLDVIDPQTGEVWADKLACRIWGLCIDKSDQPIGTVAVFTDIVDTAAPQTPVLSIVLIPTPASCIVIECVDHRSTSVR